MGNRTTIPSGWSSSAIGSVCTFSRGVSWKKSQERRSPTAGAVPVLRIPNVQETLELTELLYIDGLTKAQQAKARVKRGWTLLVGSNGNPKRVGNCVYVAEPRDFLFASFLIGAKPTYPRRVSSEFLYRLLSSNPVQNDIWHSVQGSTGLSNIDLNSLKGLHVPIPPLPEQRKIAAILSSVDDAIEKTQAVIDQVQVVKRGLMQELLTRGLPGRHTSFNQTAVGPIPEDWQVLTIGELGHDPRTAVRTGPFGSSMKTKDFRASGVPVITIQSLGEGALNSAGLFFVSQEKADELSEYSVEEGDLVFSRVADIGRSLSVDASQSGYLISPNLMRIRPDRRKVDARFLMYAITLAKGVLRQIDSLSGNVGRPVVSSSILRRLSIPMPPLVEQREIARAGRRLESRISTEMASLALLKELKTALMSVLLTGEVRVIPDSNAA